MNSSYNHGKSIDSINIINEYNITVKTNIDNLKDKKLINFFINKKHMFINEKNNYFISLKKANIIKIFSE